MRIVAPVRLALPIIAYLLCISLRAQSPLADTASTVQSGVKSDGKAAQNPDEAVMLSAFEVRSEKDVGYQAMSTIAGTRTNEQLRDLPVAVSILNKDFIRDIAATDVGETLRYAIGVESISSAFGVGNDYGGGGNALTFRGIQASWQGRDGFIWYAVSDNFDTEMLEVNRGPSGNVFGDSRAGGVLDIVSKRAKLANFSEWNLRWDSEGSKRTSLDANRRLSDKAALRVNLLYSDQKDWRDTTHDNRQSEALAFQYDLTPRTRFRSNIEYNKVTRVPPRSLTTDNFSTTYVLGSGSNGTATPAGTATIQAAGNVERWTIINDQRVNLTSTASNIFRLTSVGNQFNTSESIIPRQMNWYGPSDHLDHDSLVLNAAIEHQLGDRTSLSFAYNLQISDRKDFTANLDGPRRDVNPNLPGPSGTLAPNPNFDKLYIEHRWTSQRFQNTVNSFSFTGVQDWDFGFTKQRLIANGSLRDDAFLMTSYQDLLTPKAIAAAGLTGAAALQTNNTVRRRYYIENGNGDRIRYTERLGDSALFPTAYSKSRADLWAASALILGRYWQNHVITAAGVRRDDYKGRNVNSIIDPSTGLAYLERDARGDELWRYQGSAVHTSWNYGAVFSPIHQARAFANYAENFAQNGVLAYFTGDKHIPLSGSGWDYGASAYLLDDRITATVTVFDAKAASQNATAIASQTEADEINALLGTKYSLANPQDTTSTHTKGYELELVTNLTKQWTLSYKYSFRHTLTSDFVPRLTATLTAMKAATTDPTKYALTQAQYNSLVNANPSSRMGWNIATRYSFANGRLKGVRIGSYAYWRQGLWAYASPRPSLYYKSYILLNAFAGYEYKVTQKITSDFQFNIENLLNKQPLIGNSYTNNSYLPPVKFILQNTFRF